MADGVNSKRPRNSKGTSPTCKTKKSKGKNYCVSCGNAVVDEAVECQWCGKLEHKNCVEISDEEYKVIDQCSQNILFFCSKCLPNLPIAMEVSRISENLDTCFKSLERELSKSIVGQILDNFNTIMQKLDQSINDVCQNKIQPVLQKCELLNANLEMLESKLTLMKGDLSSLMKESTDNFESIDKKLNSKSDLGMVCDTATAVSSPAKSTKQFSTIISSVLNEEKDKARRRLNLIVHRVPESQADTGTTRRDDDINFVTSCLKDHLDMSVTIEKAFRLGKRSDTQSDRPRLLKITLNSERDRSMILKKCAKLRNNENPAHIKKVFFTPDLTPGELELNKKLRADLKEKNKDKNLYCIKNGKLC